MESRIVFNDDAVGRYVSLHASTGYTRELDSNVGRVDSNGVVGGVVFSNHTGATCFLSAAGRNQYWLCRDLIWAMFHYPFVQLGYSRIHTIVRSDNEPSINLNLRLGLREAYRMERFYVGADALVFVLDREDCKWLNLVPRTIRARE